MPRKTQPRPSPAQLRTDAMVKELHTAGTAPSNRVVMRFNGHDIEGDAATLADINNKLGEHATMLEALRDIAAYPLNVEGYNSESAVRLRFVAVQTRARAALGFNDTRIDINRKLAQHTSMLNTLRWAVAAYPLDAEVPAWVEEARAVIARVVRAQS